MFLIAEIGASHNRKLRNVIRMIRETEADAIKLQTWSKDSMAVSHRLESGLWAGKNLVDLYRKAHLPWEWHATIFDACRIRNIVPFSSPFDIPSVDFLERLDCPMYKIASYELVDLRLVEYVAMTGKPMIMSCGQADTHEIRAAVNTAQKYCDDITLLHCVSQYPLDMSEVNLKTMNALKRFDCKIGLSDHTKGSQVAVMAATLGASVIEKHVGLNGSGLDGGFSMRCYQFNKMAAKVRAVERVMGEVKFGGDTELRRSLYFTANIPKGTRIDHRHLKTARPNKGLTPIKIDKIIGKRLNQDVAEDQAVMLKFVG
jgi:N-acetylneuraminate synthase